MDIKIADTLKKLRHTKGVKQEDVAKAIGISKSGYGYYEQGRSMPDPQMLSKLSKYFNVSVDYLLGEDTKTFFIDNYYDYLIDILKSSGVDEKISMTREQFGKELFNALISKVDLKNDNTTEISIYGADKSNEISSELKELLNSAKTLTTEQIQKLTEFIKTLK